jgi:outer membrane protein TolC
MHNPIANIAIVTLIAISGCTAPSSNLQNEINDIMLLKPENKKIRNTEKIAEAMDLKSAILKSIPKDPTFMAAAAKFREKDYRVKVESASRKMQLNADATSGFMREESKLSTDNTAGISASLRLSQLVYDGGQTDARVELARIDSINAANSLKAIASSVAFDVASAVVEYQTSTAQLQLLDEFSKRANKLRDQIQKLTSSGLIDKSILLSADSEIGELNLRQLQLSEKKDRSINEMLRFFQKVPNENFVVESPLSEINTSDLNVLWQTAPEIKSSAGALLAARYQLRLAEAAMSPTVSANAGVSSPMSNDDPTTYSLGLVANWTIGDGGRRKAKIDASKQSLSAAQNELDSIKQETKRKFDAGLSKKQTLIKQIKEILNKKRRADTKLQILSDQMSTGQTNMKEILSANAAVYQISDQIITLRSELTILQYELARNSDSLLNFIDFDVTVSTENAK